VFRGRHEHAIDAKGRTSLPSRFREALATTGDSQIVMTPDLLLPYLRVYPLQEWNRQEAALSDESAFAGPASAGRRFAIGEAQDCDVDKLGRVLIPAMLREHVGLERDVYWIGVGNGIELWDKSTYLDHRAKLFADPEQLNAVAQHLSTVRAK
jgi:MraZ protein